MYQMDKVLVKLRMMFKKDNGYKTTLTAKEVAATLDPLLVAKVMKLICWLELFTKDGRQLCATAVGAGHRTIVDKGLVTLADFENPEAQKPKRPRKAAKPRPFTQQRREKLLKNMETLDHNVLLNAAGINALTYLTDYYQNARHAQDVARFLRGVYFLELRESLAGTCLTADKSQLTAMVQEAYADSSQWTNWHRRLLPLLAAYFDAEVFADYQAKLAKITRKKPLDEKVAEYQQIQEMFQRSDANELPVTTNSPADYLLQGDIGELGLAVNTPSLLPTMTTPCPTALTAESPAVTDAVATGEEIQTASTATAVLTVEKASTPQEPDPELLLPATGEATFEDSNECDPETQFAQAWASQQEEIEQIWALEDPEEILQMAYSLQEVQKDAETAGVVTRHGNRSERRHNGGFRVKDNKPQLNQQPPRNGKKKKRKKKR